jgi:IS30 family transposase
MSICTHLAHEERYQIYALKKARAKQTEIAALLGRSPSTISRDLRRTFGRRGYRPKQAQQMAEGRARTSCTRRRITERQWQGVGALIRQDLEPRADRRPCGARRDARYQRSQPLKLLINSVVIEQYGFSLPLTR